MNEIARFTEDDMNKAIEKAEANEDSDNSDSEYEDVANKVKASGINHEDLFNAERGKARVAQGDEAFEEEMGGQSQMIHVATAFACENFESDTGDEGTGDEEEKGAPTKMKHVLQSLAEEIDLEPSPVKSSSARGIESENSRNASSAEDSAPITQPIESTMKHRNRVSIMGVVFEDNKKIEKKAEKKKKSGLYIPSYSKSKK